MTSYHEPWTSRWSALASALCLAAVALGCDGPRTSAADAPSFEYSVRGQLEREIHGVHATSGLRTVPQAGTVWSLQLSAGVGNGDGSLAFISPEGAPNSGTHELSDAPTPAELEGGEVGLFAVLASEGDENRFIGSATSGEITIEDAGEGAVSGTFEATLAGTLYVEGSSGAPDTLRVSGSFTAHAE